MSSGKVFKNASWMIGCKLVQALLTFVITMLTARYLGPSDFGVISYATSLALFVTPIVKLGLDNILVRELVKSPECDGKLLGTSIVLGFISALLNIIGIVLFASVANPGDNVTVIVCALYAIVLLFQGSELIGCWFQARYLSKYTSLVSLAAYLLVTLYRIVLLISGSDVYLFAVANALDFFVIELLLLFFYFKLGGGRLEFSFELAVRMLSVSRYYIIPNLMVAVFSQTDRIMLDLLIDEAAVGIYSAALSCAGLANFVYSAIITAFTPMILEEHDRSHESFDKLVSALYSIIIYLSLMFNLAVTLFSGIIIGMIYGSEYAAAVTPLGIAVWYSTFAFVGSVRDVWILAKERQKYLWVINLSGAVGNVIVNYLLIPSLGISGAALASLLTQIIANVAVTGIISGTRQSVRLMLRALDPRVIKTLLAKERQHG